VSVEVVEYDDAWPVRFTAEADQIRAALESQLRRIEHVGSTAVPGLPAKPIIDVALSVETSDSLVDALGKLGYEYDERRFSKPGYELYAYEQEDEEFLDHVRLRDYLRTHDEDRDVYGALKHGDDEDAKNAFVARLVEMLRRG
jgi:GrpB-like predicted nucleotidyltransferase (UPF0157 family)